MGINAQSELMIAIPFTRGRAHDAANDHAAARWPAESTPRGLRPWGRPWGRSPRLNLAPKKKGRYNVTVTCLGKVLAKTR